MPKQKWQSSTKSNVARVIPVKIWYLRKGFMQTSWWRT